MENLVGINILNEIKIKLLLKKVILLHLIFLAKLKKVKLIFLMMFIIVNIINVIIQFLYGYKIKIMIDLQVQLIIFVQMKSLI